MAKKKANMTVASGISSEGSRVSIKKVSNGYVVSYWQDKPGRDKEIIAKDKTELNKILDKSLK